VPRVGPVSRTSGPLASGRAGCQCQPLLTWSDQRVLQKLHQEDQREIKRLQQDLRRKDKALAEAAALL
jgi:hypothetical protein